jgi:N-acetylmuramoyl-L-alanine amidase
MIGKRASVILLAVAIAASTVLGQTTLLQQATNAFNTAQHEEKVLNEKPQSEQTRTEVLKVINDYQRVYLITPRTSYADDALIAIARLYERIKDSSDAIKTLKFLVHDYPQSPFKKAAENDIASLSANIATVQSVPETRVDSKVDSKDPKNDAQTDPKSVAKVTVDNIRYWEAEKSLRVVVDLSGEVTFKQGEARSPDRVFIDIAHTRLNPSLISKEWHVESGMLQKIRVGQNDSGTVRVVLDLGTMLRATSFTLRDPDRLIIDVIGESDAAIPPPVELDPKQTITDSVPLRLPAPPPAVVGPAAVASAPVATAAVVATSPVTLPVVITTAESKSEIKTGDPGPQMASTAKPTSFGSRSLIRSLGLKVTRVVIDAGHGGHDTGSIGPTGYTEKDLVLDVAKRLKTLIETEFGAEVVMTRSDDSFVPLETRTAIANQQEADLFISIHANSSKTRTVRGVETFFLNFTTSKDALDTASRENAGSDKSVHELQDLVKRIVLADKVTESRELAQRVQTAMARAKGTGPDRGVKQAPFVVLIGANMPSILAEISFISNPDEEKVLRTPAYRQHIAESLFDGVRSYADTLSGVKTARSIEKN